jgi:hypothetical protein
VADTDECKKIVWLTKVDHRLCPPRATCGESSVPISPVTTTPETTAQESTTSHNNAVNTQGSSEPQPSRWAHFWHDTKEVAKFVLYILLSICGPTGTVYLLAALKTKCKKKKEKNLIEFDMSKMDV